MEKQNILKNLLKLVEKLNDDVEKLEEKKAKKIAILRTLDHSKKIEKYNSLWFEVYGTINRKIGQITTAINSLENAINLVKEIGEKQ